MDSASYQNVRNKTPDAAYFNLNGIRQFYFEFLCQHLLPGNVWPRFHETSSQNPRTGKIFWNPYSLGKIFWNPHSFLKILSMVWKQISRAKGKLQEEVEPVGLFYPREGTYHFYQMTWHVHNQSLFQLVNIFREKCIQIPSLLIYSSNCNTAHFGFQYIAF